MIESTIPESASFTVWELGGAINFSYMWRRQPLHQQSSAPQGVLVFGKEADKLIRRMAERMNAKRGETYSSVVSFLRRRFRFDLLKTCIITLRGYKKPSRTPAKIETLDMDLGVIATSC